MATGIEDLRAMVKLFNACAESFCERWSVEDLHRIYRAHKLCTWDVYPDRWTERQLSRASCLATPPMFREPSDRERAHPELLVDGLVPLTRSGAAEPEMLYALATDAEDEVPDVD